MRAGVLSFASPKESSQRKGDPWVGAGCAGSLRYSGLAGAAELGLRPQTVLALFPVAPCAARRRKGQIEKHRNFTANAVSDALGFPPPSCSAEQRRRAGGSRRGLSEGRSPDFRSRPASRVAQGSQRSWPRNAGVAFFLVTFSWRRKKKLHAVRAGCSVSKPPPHSIFQLKGSQ